MKIQGRLDSLQSSLEFYTKLVNTSDCRTVDSLRTHYYDKFLEDVRKNTVKVNKPEEQVVSSAKRFLSAVSSMPISTEENTPVPFSVSTEEVAIPEQHGLYLDEVEVIEEVVNEYYTVEEDSYKEIHGVYLEDIDLSRQKIITDEDNNKENSEIPKEIHGIYLEDIDLSVVDNIPKEDIHGLYLEDIELYKDSQEEPPFTEETNGYLEEQDEFSEYQEDYEEEFNVESEDENNIIAFKPKEEFGLEISKHNEPEEIHLPATVREYVKKHQGIEYSELVKLYPKKQIEKERSLMKINIKNKRCYT